MSEARALSRVADLQRQLTVHSTAASATDDTYTYQADLKVRTRALTHLSLRGTSGITPRPRRDAGLAAARVRYTLTARVFVVATVPGGGAAHVQGSQAGGNFWRCVCEIRGHVDEGETSDLGTLRGLVWSLTAARHFARVVWFRSIRSWVSGLGVSRLVSRHRSLRRTPEIMTKFLSPDSPRLLQSCRDELKEFINEINCHPILLRLAWHDAGTFDESATKWPDCGGANGSIRFDPEINHGANAGLAKGLFYLKPFHNKFPRLSWADLIQLGGATAIECAGGPKVPMRYGRVVGPRRHCPPRH